MAFSMWSNRTAEAGGISWRMMPTDLPDWRLVYYYFRQWAKQGLVQQIHDQLVTKVRLQAGREASLYGSTFPDFVSR